MTPIFSMVLMLATVIAVSLIGIILYNLYRQNKIERVRAAFEQVAAGFGLSIPRPDIMGNICIGFDRVNSKFLLIEFSPNAPRKYLVDFEWQARLSRNLTTKGYPVKKYKRADSDNLPVYGETIVLTY